MRQAFNTRGREREIRQENHTERERDRERRVMSSSRKRKAPDAAHAAAQASSSTAVAGPRNEQPLVPATPDLLKELRLRFRSVTDEAAAKKLAGKASSTESGAAAGGRSKSGGGATAPEAAAAAGPTATAYLRAFQAAVASNVQAMCQLPEPCELREEDELFTDILQFCEDAQAVNARLAATRARVARLSADTCRDALRVSAAADDRACSVLEARTKHAQREKEVGGPLPLAPAANGDSGGGADGDVDTVASFSGIDPNVMEPKISALIGKLAELPGPLKSVLQEMPELTASLAVSVQNAESAMEKRESRTEALLGKAPPTPLPSKKRRAAGAGAGAGGAAGGAGDERPEEVRSAAREARVEQARKEWEAGGVGVAGSIFS